MTDLEKAARQARDWIAERPEDRAISAGKMVSILTSALQQPAQQEPFKQLAQDSFMSLWQNYCDKKMEVEDLKEQINQLTAQQEPVAFDATIEDEEALATLRDMVVQDDGDLTPIRLVVGGGHSGYGLYIASADYPDEGSILLHEHTRHQAREPLTDEEKVALCKQFPDHLTFNAIRAIEAAHGIKGDA